MPGIGQTLGNLKALREKILWECPSTAHRPGLVYPLQNKSPTAALPDAVGGAEFYILQLLVLPASTNLPHDHPGSPEQPGSEQQKRTRLRNEIDRSGEVKPHIDLDWLEHIKGRDVMARRQ
jgi:hypothetical protein